MSVVTCPDCGSRNVAYRAVKDEYECLACGHKWGRGYGKPKGEAERRLTHEERYGSEELPPRGTGVMERIKKVIEEIEEEDRAFREIEAKAEEARIKAWKSIRELKELLEKV